MLDAIVIGGGINGSWTALHLAKRGQNVTLLDQVWKNNFKSHILPTYIFMVQSFHCPTLVEVRMDKVEEYAKPIPNRFWLKWCMMPISSGMLLKKKTVFN